jgi:hypothetical protein
MPGRSDAQARGHSDAQARAQTDPHARAQTDPHASERGHPQAPGPGDPLADRVRAAGPGLEALVARARAVQQERAATAKERGAPRWTDVFTTQFTEFSNRPRG